MQLLKHTASTPAPVHQPHFADQAVDRMLMLADHLGFPQSDNENEISLEVLENFIDKELRSRLVPDDYYHGITRLFKLKSIWYEYIYVWI